MRTRVHSRLATGVAFAALSVLGACASSRAPEPFRIAVIPDTQNYVDYTHQKAEGFALDASELFIAQMQWIAERSRANAGDIAFVASVGDVWQHQSLAVEPGHAARGIDRLEESFFGEHFAPTPRTREVEIPKAIEGYELLHAAQLPFGVAPGNHDYDAMWNAEGFPPDFSKPRAELTIEDVGVMHVGGLENFRSAFGDRSDFFRDADWYVASFRGGTNSAQIFHGGGYRFLHLALEMSADDAVVAWAQSVIDAHPGLPTIVTTHDYLDARGERRPNPVIDLVRVDPAHHNSADQLFAKLIAPNDQVFLVLCGHHHGQARRVDPNASGHEVHQILSDYQDRGQVGIDAGQPPDAFFRKPVGIGDGWFRLMTFDPNGAAPTLRVRTYSTHYSALSSELATYAEWYREHEQPGLSDAEFLATDEFELVLGDFRERFGAPRLPE